MDAIIARSNEPVVAVAQLGARRHYTVPRIMWRAGLLGSFFTDITTAHGWARVIRAIGAWGLLRGPGRRLALRIPKEIPRSRIVHFPAFAWEFRKRLRHTRTADERSDVYLWAGREFCRQINLVGLKGITAVYAFNSAGLELLAPARQRGLLCITDQTGAPCELENHFVSEERELWAGWENDGMTCDHIKRFADRERAEWNLANLIICGSDFVREGVGRCGGPLEKCVVVPYGVDVPSFVTRHGEAPRARGPIRILTVGSVRLLKGTPYLLKAAEALRGHAVFRVVGETSTISPKVIRRLAEAVDLTGPVPRNQMSGHYAWADVFLLPSVCEGSARVCYEALAAGLPVIATPNAGSVVRDGSDGFIVPIRDSDAIVERIRLLSSDRDSLIGMSRNAISRASEYTVDKYSRRLLEAVDVSGTRAF